jgi:hypothetical protein
MHGQAHRARDNPQGPSSGRVTETRLSFMQAPFPFTAPTLTAGQPPLGSTVPSSIQAQKRQRATAFPSPDAAAQSCGLLDVSWDSAFDRLCYLVSAPDLKQKNNRRYTKLLTEIMTGSGCTEEEVLAHGHKVRAYLFFAQDRLMKSGQLDQLTGKEKYPYRLPPVEPAF